MTKERCHPELVEGYAGKAYAPHFDKLRVTPKGVSAICLNHDYTDLMVNMIIVGK